MKDEKQPAPVVETCPTIVIEDIPAEKDELATPGEIGPHERVSLAIADIIKSNEEPGGKMIGLEGDWGSGKSTVIKLIQDKLSKSPNIKVVIFDAWAHEGDPLRRTFLESLIKYFQTENWINKLEWDKDIAELAKRRKIINTKTFPQITLLGKLFSISLLLIPLGSVLLAAALKDGIGFDRKLPPSYTFIFGLPLLITPLIVLFVNWLLIRWSSKENKAKYDWTFLTGHLISETNQETIETPEPTSLEFEDRFRKLMSDALSVTNRKIVIVLDNLDRVDAKYALSIWSTLQTFLHDRNAKSEVWFKNLWIIVPYDANGIRQLWDQNNPEADNSIADSFIDKSFQLIFRVPPLVLSNWKSYLLRLLAKALPKHSDKYNSIYNVFNLGRNDLGISPTPRQLKLFVNSIGVIHRQWEDKFPLDHVAYFALLVRENKKIIQGLRGAELPSKAMSELLGQDLRANLAGLIYNVKASEGQQLLLRDPILYALYNNNPKKLIELKENHDIGFWDVIEQISPSIFADIVPARFTNSVSCIVDSKVLVPQDITNTETTKKLLLEITKKATLIDRWAPFNLEMVKGIIAMCALVGNTEFSKMAIAKVRTTIDGSDNLPIDETTLPTLVELVKGILSLKNQENIIGEEFILPVSEEMWFNFSPTLEKEDKAIWKFFNPRYDIKQMVGTLSKIIETGQYSSIHYSSINVLCSIYGYQAEWESLLTAIGYFTQTDHPFSLQIDHPKQTWI